MLINDKGIFKHKYYSEVSLTEGLVAWYPLDGTPRDLVDMNDGTVYGATPVQGLNQLCYSFDGVDDYILSTENSGIVGDPEFTVSYWMYWNDTTWSSDWSSGFGINAGGTANGLSTTWSAGRPALDFWNYRWRATTPAQVRTWNHCVFTKTKGNIGSTSKIYINNSIQNANLEGSDVPPNITNSRFVIGRLDSTRWFKGLIQDVRTYNRALSDTEIELLYKTTGGSNTRMEALQDKVYLTGILKEI